MLLSLSTLWGIVYKFYWYRYRYTGIAAHFSHCASSSSGPSQDKFARHGFAIRRGWISSSSWNQPAFRRDFATTWTRKPCGPYLPVLQTTRQERLARAPISLHSQWIHKYKLLNFVTWFKFAPTGEETWSWIHCLIRAHLATMYQVHNCVYARVHGTATPRIISLF